MTRYSVLYFKCEEELRSAQDQLAKCNTERENYRLFIQESGNVPAFIEWWAKTQGFSESTIDSIRHAFDAATPAQEQA